MSRPGPAPRAVPAAWGPLLADHEAWMRAAGAQPDQVRLRHHYVRLLADSNRDPGAVTPQALIELLGRAGWSASTRKSARTQLRSFFAWAAAEGRIACDPAAGLPSVRVPIGVPRPTPDEVMRRALEAASSRERLMLLLGVLAGLRRAEIAGVHSRDIIGDQLVVRGKGGRQRIVPLHPVLAEALAEVEGWAFPSRDPRRPISPGRVGVLLTRLLDGHTPHSLRHAFASRAYSVNRDLLAVQQLLGHASVATTQVYTALPADALRAAVHGPTGFALTGHRN